MSEEEKTILGFDSSIVIKSVIKCDDQFAMVFLIKTIKEVSNDWEGSRIGLIPLENIPRRPRVRVWLPQLKVDTSKVLLWRKGRIPTFRWTTGR